MLTRDDKAGLYLTVIFHLVILIILLIAQIGFSLQKENSFVIDFTKQEEIEAREKKQRFDEEVEKKVDDLIAAKVDRMLAGMSGVEFRNTTTSRNKGALKDDRNTDAEKLYADAEKLAKDLKNGPKAELSNDDFVETPSKTQKKTTRRQTRLIADLPCCHGIWTTGKPATFRYRHTDATEEAWLLS